jgi:uncharacterized damage-inducible protein DinB
MNSNAYTITSQEKQFAIDHLNRTGKAFINAIAGMSDKQWYLRPGPGEWSAAECAQHLLETELYYFLPTVEKMLAEAAAPERMAESAGKDQAVIDSMEIRNHKIKGQPWEESPDKKIDKAALIAAFEAKRADNIRWLENSDGNFRANFIEFPGMGLFDVYQFILFISAHTTRHTGQIQDIAVLQAA